MDKHVMIGSSAESPMSPFGRPGFGRSQLEHSTRLREVVLMLAVEYGAKSKIHRKMDDMLPFLSHTQIYHMLINFLAFFNS